MLKGIRALLKRTGNVSWSTYIWNTANATLSAFQSVIILAVMTRTNGIEDAGVFSIAYAVASLMLFVGQYGIRRFQASDIRGQFVFGEYHGMRILTCLIMIMASAGYSFYGLVFQSYSTEKTIVIFLICLLKVVQAYADVFHGLMQQNGRLDVAAKSSFVRIALGTLSYVLCLALTQHLLLSTAVCLFVSTLVFVITSVNAARDFSGLSPFFHAKALKNLTIAGFPLFLSLFLSLYIGNAPKYAIDAYLSDEIQAYYNFIFMPAFMVQLVANFIFNPILTKYAHIWLNGEFKRFKRILRRQVFVIFGLSVAGVVGAYLVGAPILSLFFGIDLTPYRMELCVVMIGGGMLAYVTFFTTVITIIRHQHLLALSYIGVALTAKMFSKYFVVNYGIMGAASLYTVLMSLLAITFLVILVVNVRRDIKKRNLAEGKETV